MDESSWNYFWFIVIVGAFLVLGIITVEIKKLQDDNEVIRNDQDDLRRQNVNLRENLHYLRTQLKELRALIDVGKLE